MPILAETLEKIAPFERPTKHSISVRKECWELITALAHKTGTNRGAVLDYVIKSWFRSRPHIHSLLQTPDITAPLWDLEDD